MVSEGSEQEGTEGGSGGSVLKSVMGVNGNTVGRIYVPKFLIGKMVKITPVDVPISPRILLETILGKRLTEDLIAGTKESDYEGKT